MDETKKLDKKPHKVIIEGRARMSVTAVEDMDSFNENEVIFLTSEGMATVTGQDLHVSKLDLTDGTIVIEGGIESLDYADHEELRQREKGGFMSRVFK